MPESIDTFRRPHPTCPYCGHKQNHDEMVECVTDLFRLVIEEDRTVVQCPGCDQEYWVLGGYAPNYTSAFSEEELL